MAERKNVRTAMSVHFGQGSKCKLLYVRLRQIRLGNMSVTHIRSLDGVSKWLLKNGFALNRKNWCELNWGFGKTDEEIQDLVALPETTRVVHFVCSFMPPVRL